MKLTKKAEKIIREAAEVYYKNRLASKVVRWDKEADVKKVFAAMEKAGISGREASAGTFFGYYGGKLFKLNIGFDKIDMGLYKNLNEAFR